MWSGQDGKNLFANTEEPTTGTYLPNSAIPKPTDPQPDKPEYESPYNPNENYSYIMMPVYQSPLNIFGMTITSPSYPNTTYLSRINVEDIITVSLAEQPDEIDIQKLSIIGYRHKEFNDPYITPVEKMTNSIFSAPFIESDGCYIAQFSIGYGCAPDQFIDVIFVYDGQIIYFTSFMTIEGDGTSDAYWEYYAPDEKIGHLTITCEDTVYDYCFFVKDGYTLEKWSHSRTNVDGWKMRSTYLTNKDETWFIPIEQCQVLLKDGMNFVATKERPAEKDFTFDATNPDYLVSYIGCNKENLVSKFGEPKSLDMLGSTEKCVYDNFSFYLSNNKVIQIDVLHKDAQIVNGLTASPMNGTKLEELANQSGIPVPDYKWITDTPSSYYCVKLPITHDNWTVCYVWENNEQFVPSEMDFTKIVIYSGEDYYY